MILAILQARYSSTRLPGKVLAPVLGRAMILRQLERLRRSTAIDQLVVATSIDSSDDKLVEVLQAEGVTTYRGSLQDVLGRFAAVVAEFAPSTIVRLTADCPLADWEVIDRVIHEHEASGADYTSNVIERTYPQGLDVECIRREAFATLLGLDLDPSEHEHVTLGIYNRPEQFLLHSVVQERDLSKHRWTVDLPDDLAFVRSIYEQLYGASPDFAQEEILALLDRMPELAHLNP